MTSLPALPAARPGSRAQRRHWLVLLICVGLLVPLRCASENRRAELQIKPRTSDEAAGLWETVSTSGAGALRAFANLHTWMQIGEAEDNREYFRLVELYRTVLRLQPRNVKIQRFLADQLMDSIAPNAADADSAWPWVREGKELLDTAARRNPRAYQIHDALAYCWFKRMADFPVRLLEFEVGRGADCLFRREPQWQALAEQTVADFHALSEDEQRAFRHAVSRISFTLLYSSNLAEFTEFSQLSSAAQSVYRRANQLRLIGEFLQWETALDPATGLPARQLPRAMRRLARRGWDVAARAEGTPDEVAAWRTLAWQHLAQAQQWLLDRVAAGDLDREELSRSNADLRHAYRTFPPGPGTVTIHGQPLTDEFFRP